MREDPRQIRAIENLAEHLKTLHRQGFFGTISIQFKAGSVGLVRQEETILPHVFEGNGNHIGKTEEVNRG